jgi:hypothetical protein
MDNENETNSAQSEVAHDKKKLNYPGPKPGVKYPLNVLYCGGEYLDFLSQKLSRY